MGATTARQLKGSGSLPPRQRRLDGRSARSSPLLDEAMLPSRDETLRRQNANLAGTARLEILQREKVVRVRAR